MHKLILAAALTLSASAFANICEVEMRDIRSGRIITVIRTNEYDSTCREAMKQCRLEIRTSGRYGLANCIKLDNTPGPYPYPNPSPRPEPTPYPYPYPDSGSIDARRVLTNGESVVYNSRYVTVAGISFQGLYAVRSTDGWNTVTNGLTRDQLAVTTGCSLNLCTSDSVINTITARYEKVAALQYNDRFVTKSTDGWNTLTSNVDRLNLAETKGCIQSRYTELCVNDQVIDTYNRYSKVAGIQRDGRVVLKSQDGWNTLTTNVDPSSLIVTGGRR